MSAEILSYNSTNIAKLGKALLAGKVVAFPTDTVFALSCNPISATAVQSIYAIKQRPKNKMLPLLIHDIKQIREFIHLNDDIMHLIQSRLGTPTTYVVKLKKQTPWLLTAKIDKYASKTLAFRIPSDKLSLELLRYVNLPLIGTSANISQQGSTYNHHDVMQQLGDRIDYIMSNEKIKQPKLPPSQILDVTDVSNVKVLRS